MIRQNLIGKSLVNGFVIEKLRSSAAFHPSGACHSIGFIAKAPDGRLAFVKVLDPTLDSAALDPLVDLKDPAGQFSIRTRCRIQDARSKTQFRRSCAGPRNAGSEAANGAAMARGAAAWA